MQNSNAYTGDINHMCIIETGRRIWRCDSYYFFTVFLHNFPADFIIIIIADNYRIVLRSKHHAIQYDCVLALCLLTPARSTTDIVRWGGGCVGRTGIHVTFDQMTCR